MDFTYFVYKVKGPCFYQTLSVVGGDHFFKIHPQWLFLLHFFLFLLKEQNVTSITFCGPKDLLSNY